jgi:Rrf2 family protein
MTSRFTMALHALGMIAVEEEALGRPVTSEALAASINTNPVVVRRVIADLRRAGLVLTRRGVSGGMALARPPGRISLRSVWEALENREQLFARHPSGPNLACPMGRCVAEYLERLYGAAETALKTEFGRVTLADLRRDLVRHLPEARRACAREAPSRDPHRARTTARRPRALRTLPPAAALDP